ncbi:MAG: YkgJ family cysteine cluster protein [Myxococcota bacterium]
MGDTPGLSAYRALLAAVDAFAAGVRARRREAVACRSGCSGCCASEPEVGPLEAEAVRRHLRALPEEARTRIRGRAASPAPGACVMLEPGGTCGIYAGRPLVCRTQGMPLRYPPGFVPVETVVARSGRDEIVWCPLNFVASTPEPDDVLDAARADAALGVANMRHCDARGSDPLARSPLRRLAAE